MNKKISVVLATYNGEKYIEEQLNSIINQSYPIHEIIVVNDCSTDNTLLIIEEFAVRFEQIKIFHNQQNKGATKSFFSALKKTSGEYIAFSDQDDVWLPNKIERLVAEVGNNLLIHCDAILVDESLSTLHCSYFAVTKDATLSSFEDYLIKNNVTGCCCMIHNELINLPLPTYFYAHDHYFALLAAFYQRIKYLPEQLVLYRQHGTNLIGGLRGEFDVFIRECHKKALSYNSLLSIELLSSQYTAIELMRDYRESFATGKWFGFMNLFKLLRFPHGIKLNVFYLLLGRLFGDRLSEWFYSKIYKLEC